MEEKLRNIFYHFGLKNQLKKLNEECYELIEAINDGNISHIEEEFSDCLVVLSQLGIYFNISPKVVEKIGNEKVDRTLDRIKKGYYEKK